MSFIAAAIALGVVAAAGTAYAANENSKSVKSAAKQNKAAQDATNALNLQMFQESRGEGGLPVFLPRYSGGDEQEFYNQARAIFNATSPGDPAATAARYEQIVEAQRPAFNAGTDLINSIFSGDLERQRLEQFEPVAQARNQVAAAQKQGILEGLSVRLNELSANRAKQGFTGSGSFSNNLALSSTIGARQKAAEAQAGAGLLNAADRRAIQEGNIDLGLRSLDLPVNRVQQAFNLEQLPAEAAGTAFNRRLNIFQPFRLQQGQFQYPQPYQVSAVPGMGQILGTAVGQAGSSVGNYFANRAIANQLNPQPAAPVYQNVPVTYNTQGSYLGDVNLGAGGYA